MRVVCMGANNPEIVRFFRAKGTEYELAGFINNDEMNWLILSDSISASSFLTRYIPELATSVLNLPTLLKTHVANNNFWKKERQRFL